jgi:hypothetical protein
LMRHRASGGSRRRRPDTPTASPRRYEPREGSVEEVTLGRSRGAMLSGRPSPTGPSAPRAERPALQSAQGCDPTAPAPRAHESRIAAPARGTPQTGRQWPPLRTTGNARERTSPSLGVGRSLGTTHRRRSIGPGPQACLGTGAPADNRGADGRDCPYRLNDGHALASPMRRLRVYGSAEAHGSPKPQPQSSGHSKEHGLARRAPRSYGAGPGLRRRVG